MDKLTADILGKVHSFTQASFSDKYEIYDISLKHAGKGLVLEVVIDHPEGIKVIDCENVSRTLEKYLDETDLIHRSFSLEVSSPGIERVFKRDVDYIRHVGRLVKWTIKPCEDRPKEVFHGRLMEYTGNSVLVQVNGTVRKCLLGEIEEARAVFEFPQKTKRG